MSDNAAAQQAIAWIEYSRGMVSFALADLVAIQGQLAEARRRITELEREREEEREQLCRDFCPHCLNGEAAQREDGGVWYHVDRDGRIEYTHGCDAWAIREYRYRRQQEAER